MNDIMYLQSTLASHLPVDIRRHLLWWLDDILIHSKTIDDHLDSLKLFFSFCVEYNFKLHPTKSIIFAPRISWCAE